MSDKPKAILILGYPRGGTSLLWNILQSHPDVVATPTETGGTILNMFPTKRVRAALRRKLGDEALIGNGALASAIRARVWAQKMRAWWAPPPGNERTPGERYTWRELSATTPCLKSVAAVDMRMTPLLRSVFDLQVVGLVRNGYALCEGWARRGMGPEEAAERYCELGDLILQGSDCLIHFEQMVADPFVMAEYLYGWLGFPSMQVRKLRLKAKPILTPSGGHMPRHGVAEKKYWFGRRGIGQVVDPGVTARQIARLAPWQREVFGERAAWMLRLLGYSFDE